jgi:hypothetical protein
MNGNGIGKWLDRPRLPAPGGERGELLDRRVDFIGFHF